MVSRRSRGSLPAAMPALDRRQFLRIFGAVAAVGATGGLAACAADPVSSSAAEQPSGLTIAIGLVAPAAGPFAKIGDDTQKGFQLYLDANQGLLGRHKVELKVADEGAT